MRDEYECHLRTLLADAELAVRVPLDALAAILRDGRFKTRHEAGPLRSSGQRFARALDDGPEKTRALQLVTAA